MSGWALADHLRVHISVQSEIIFLMNILVSVLILNCQNLSFNKQVKKSKSMCLNFKVHGKPWNC